MSMREVFETAAELVEAGWTQGADARNEAGESVIPTLRAAKTFCAWGALVKAACQHRVSGLPMPYALSEYIQDDAEPARYWLLRWNDEEGRTMEEVAALLRTAGKKFD